MELNAKLLGEKSVSRSSSIRVASILVQPPLRPATNLLVFPYSATLGRRPVANELLNMAMYDSICIMHEIVSGEVRIRDRR